MKKPGIPYEIPSDASDEVIKYLNDSYQAEKKDINSYTKAKESAVNEVLPQLSENYVEKTPMAEDFFREYAVLMPLSRSFILEDIIARREQGQDAEGLKKRALESVNFFLDIEKLYLSLQSKETLAERLGYLLQNTEDISQLNEEKKRILPKLAEFDGLGSEEAKEKKKTEALKRKEKAEKELDEWINRMREIEKSRREEEGGEASKDSAERIM